MQPCSVRWQNLGTIPLAIGGKSPAFKLPRGAVYRYLALRLRMNITIATANNTAALTLRGGEWSTLSDISLFSNSADVTRRYSGELLRARNFINGIPTSIVNGLGDNSATFNAGGNIDNTIVLPLWSLGDGKRPIDTALDSSVISDFRLETTCNALASCINPNITINSAALDVHATVHDVENDDPTQPNPYAPGGPFTSRLEQYLTTQVLTAGSDYDQQLLVGPKYVGFFINALNTAAPAVDSSAVISNVKIMSGSTIYYDRPWTVQNLVQNNYTMPGTAFLRDGVGVRNWTAALAAAGGAGLGSLYSQTPFMFENLYEQFGAWSYINLCEDGLFTEGLDTNNWGEIKLRISPGAAGYARIIPVQLFPPRV
jgi:hypothetical protein